MRAINILPAPRSLSLALPLALGAVFLLAACTGGGGPSDEGSTPTAQETQTPAEAGTPEVTQAPTQTAAPEATQPTPEETAEPTVAAGEPSYDANDPCSLLSEAEVEAAVGQPVVLKSATETFCGWSRDPGGFIDPSLASLRLRVSTLESCTGTYDHNPDVFGLGVEAWWVAPVGAVTQGNVVACPEGWIVDLAVDLGPTGFSEAALRAAAEELMAKVLERL